MTRRTRGARQRAPPASPPRAAGRRAAAALRLGLGLAFALGLGLGLGWALTLTLTLNPNQVAQQLRLGEG